MNAEDIIATTEICALPFISIHRDPKNWHSPCCVCPTEPLDKADTLDDYVNSDFMKGIRKDMLDGKIPEPCADCIMYEKRLGQGMRKTFLQERHDELVEALSRTDADGTLHDFKMHYYDWRSSSVCNFKCRTCGPTFSTQWNAEVKKHPELEYIVGPSFDMVENTIKQDIIAQIPNITKFYFAGGEPLTDDFHYEMLTEIVKHDTTYKSITYNSNVSKLKYKDYDLLELWRQFSGEIDLSMSIDHVGERAEYIRHGTVWSTIEQNLALLKHTNATMSVNCVVSNLNVLTLEMIVDYMEEHDIELGFFPLTTPEEYSVTCMPPSLHEQARQIVASLHARYPEITGPLLHTVNGDNTWDQHGEMFIKATETLDRIRSENFSETFPELASIYE